MARQLDYPDAYLAKFCTDDREERGEAEVDRIESARAVEFSASWREQLIRLKTYCIACLENQAAPDDLFTVKLKSYRAEFDAALAQAVADANTTAGDVTSSLVFAVPIERG